MFDYNTYFYVERKFIFMANITAIRLPNGKIKITKSDIPNSINEEFNSADEFYSKYQVVNESTGVVNNCILLESING